jgi:phosphatidylinositol 4-kinase type 2
MPDRSDYQPLPQTADDEPDLDPEDFSTATSPTRHHARGIRRMNAPGAIDLRKLDAAFKRFVVSLSCRYASEQD